MYWAFKKNLYFFYSAHSLRCGHLFLVCFFLLFLKKCLVYHSVDVITLNVSMIKSGLCEGLPRMEKPAAPLHARAESSFYWQGGMWEFSSMVTKPFVLLHVASDVGLRLFQCIKYCTKDTFWKGTEISLCLICLSARIVLLFLYSCCVCVQQLV